MKDARERRTGRPSLEQAEEIDRIILESATQVYLREGTTVTMKAIVQATGLSSKTVYARYPNKNALLLAALRWLFRKALPVMDLSQVDGTDIHASLREFILRSIQVAYRPESIALQRMLTADPNFGRELNTDIFQTLDRILLDPLATFLERARAAGWVRCTDPPRAARSLMTLILAEPVARHKDRRPPPDPSEMAERADFIADLFFHGIAPRSMS